MKNSIHELIGIVLLIGVLATACLSTLRKFTSLSKYVAKMYATIKTAAIRQHHTSAIHTQRITPSKKRNPAWHLVVSLFIVAFIVWDVLKSGPPTRMDMLNTALGVCAVSFVMMSYLLGRVANIVESVMDYMIEISEKQDDAA